MRLWLILKLLMVLLVAASLGYLLQQDSGVMLLAWNGYSITSTLWLGFGMLLLLALVLFLLSKVLQTKTGWQRWQQQRQYRQQLHANQQLQQGINLLLNDQFRQANKVLQRYQANSPVPWLNSLLTSHCLKQLQQEQQAMTILEQAGLQYPELRTLFTWQQIELLREEQPEKALAMAQNLLQQEPDNSLLLKQNLQLNLQLRDHRAAIGLLPRLLSSQDQTKEQLLLRLSKALIQGKLSLPLLQEKEQQALIQLSEKISVAKTPVILKAGLALALISQEQQQAAASLLQRSLKQEYNSQLVGIYGRLSIDGKKQQSLLNKWLEEHETDPELQLALARFHMRHEQWTDARQCLERAHGLGAEQALLELIRWAQLQQDQELLASLTAQHLEQLLSDLPPLK